MNAPPLIQGAVLGFSIAAPIGPIGVLCIRRTLAHGRAYGLASGLGAATADAFYGCVAGLGLGLVELLLGAQDWLRVAGALFLGYLGVQTFLASPAIQSPATEEVGKGRGWLGAYLSALGLTLTNPMTILSFLAIFTSVGIEPRGSGRAAVLFLVLGVFGGSMLWWLILCSAAQAVRGRLDRSGLRWVNRISGAVIVAFALAALWPLVMARGSGRAA